MIDLIRTGEVSQESDSEADASTTIAVYARDQTITAHIALTRISDHASDQKRMAKAFIREYCFYNNLSPFPVQCVGVGPPLPNPIPPDVWTGKSVMTLRHAKSVTFQLQVQNAYARATWMVFIEGPVGSQGSAPFGGFGG